MVPVTSQRLITIVVACVVVAGLVLPAGGALGGAGDDASGSAADEAADSPSVTVDCEESVVRVAASPTTEYRAQVAVVAVGATGSATTRTARGPLSGNATLDFDGPGFVHAFVTNSSSGNVTASVVADCTEDPATTTVSGVESVMVDCAESIVRVAAASDVRYDVRVTTVRVSPTRQSVTSVTTGPYAGNATVQFNGIGDAASSGSPNATVYAFVSTHGDGAGTVKTVARCPPANATTTPEDGGDSEITAANDTPITATESTTESG